MFVLKALSNCLNLLTMFGLNIKIKKQYLVRNMYKW